MRKYQQHAKNIENNDILKEFFTDEELQKEIKRVEEFMKQICKEVKENEK